MSHPIPTMVYEQEGYALKKNDTELLLDATGTKFVDPYDANAEMPLIVETKEDIEKAMNNNEVNDPMTIIQVKSDSWGDVEYFFQKGLNNDIL